MLVVGSLNFDSKISVKPPDSYVFVQVTMVSCTSAWFDV